MASYVMRSSRLMVFVLTLGVWVRALPIEKLVELHPIGLNTNYTEPAFDAAQYKEYLTNLKCPEITILHEGVKIPEVATGTIYQPTTTPLPPSDLTSLLPLLPNPPPSLTPSTEAPVAQQTNAPITLQQTTTAPGSTAHQTTEIPTEPIRNVPAQPTSIKPSQVDLDKFPEYDEDVDKKGEKDQDEKLPDHNKNQSNGTDSGVASSGTKVVGTSASDNEECTAPLTWQWTDYNWYQILLDNGGPPGAYLQKGFKANLTKAVDPCSRPFLHLPPAKTETTFRFTHAEFEKVYRTEQTQVRFPGTPLEYLDITGQLIWSPPDSKRRYFHFFYNKDDTGLYFNLNRKQKCVFKPDYYVRVQCEYAPLICDCVNGKESCYDLQPAAGLPAGLNAALVGGGR